MGQIKDVLVPDIGNFDTVDVLEVLVAPGQAVQRDESLLTLESDKASMDVPAPFAGTVRAIKVKAGDKVGQGALVLTLEAAAEAPAAKAAEAKSAEGKPTEAQSAEIKAAESKAAESKPAETKPAETKPAAAVAAPPATGSTTGRQPSPPPPPGIYPLDEDGFLAAYASPAVRRFARELGVELGRVHGTGRSGRILREDVQGFVKEALATPAPQAAGSGIPAIPVIDFARFGEIETVPLSRIRRLSAAHLHRAWLNVPHVTQHDHADITELEAFRQGLAEEAKAAGVKLTPLAFLLKAAVAALKAFPDFNASLAADGESLIRKRYFHLGVAVDTPDGLLVPVLRNVDQKGLFDLARELAEVSARARDGKLRPDDLQGGTFSISSLGGIGGTAFTPIVNAPEVAILGVSRSALQPVWNGSAFAPRLLLPLSLSYDHRVIDGAAAVRFTTYLGRVLGDLRRLLL